MQNIPGCSLDSKIHEGSDSVIYCALADQSGEPVIIKSAREEHPPAALIKRNMRRLNDEFLVESASYDQGKPLCKL